MKAIKIDKNIISLENVSRVQGTICGRGTKSCPYDYYIQVNFHSGKEESVEVESEEAQNEFLDKIYNILTEEKA